MTTALRRLRIDRVDFVDKGANPGAFITLAKRHNEEMPMADKLPEDVAKKLADQAEAIEALSKRAEDAEKKAESTEALAKKMADDLAVEVEKRETAESETLSKALVLPGVTDKVAFVKAIRQTPVAAQILDVLKALSVADRTSEVFKELGSDAPAGTAKDPEARMSEMADAVVKSGKAPNHAAAMKAVLDTPEGKAEYAQYKANKTRKGA